MCAFVCACVYIMNSASRVSRGADEVDGIYVCVCVCVWRYVYVCVCVCVCVCMFVSINLYQRPGAYCQHARVYHISCQYVASMYTCAIQLNFICTYELFNVQYHTLECTYVRFQYTNLSVSWIHCICTHVLLQWFDILCMYICTIPRTSCARAWNAHQTHVGFVCVHMDADKSIYVGRAQSDIDVSCTTHCTTATVCCSTATVCCIPCGAVFWSVLQCNSVSQSHSTVSYTTSVSKVAYIVYIRIYLSIYIYVFIYHILQNHNDIRIYT